MFIMEEVTIYTDGACSGNPGPGGWGSILMMGENRKEISGGSANTTNNIMELTAVIEALKMLKEGKRMCRKGWNGKGMYIEVQFPNENSKMTQPYIFIKTADDNKIPWVTSQADVFAEDYMLYVI